MNLSQLVEVLNLQKFSDEYPRARVSVIFLKVFFASFCNGQISHQQHKGEEPSCVGIHWIALAEYSQMSTHVPGFQSFFRVFA